MMINDTYAEALFKVSDNAEVNQYIKGIYSSRSLDLSQFSLIRLRKRYETISEGVTVYANQIIFGTVPAYSKGYSTPQEALENLSDVIVVNTNGFAFTILVNWAAIPVNTDKEISIAGCSWIDVSDMAATLKTAVELLKRRDFETGVSQFSGWPTVLNNRIRFVNHSLADKFITNYEENHILDTSSVVDEYFPGKENIIVNEGSEGDFCIHETINTLYNDINLVKKKSYNPTFERIEHRNSTFVDTPDGSRTFFYLPDFLCSRTAIDVYKNGLRLKLGTDYEAYPEHDLIVFSIPPALGDTLVCDFVSKQEHFYVNTRFDGVNVRELPNYNNPFNTKRLYLDGIDISFFSNNNFTLNRFGFAPMQFLVEPCSEGYEISIGSDMSISLNQKYLIFKHGIPGSNAICSRTECQISNSIKTNRLVSEVEVFIPSGVYQALMNQDSINWLTLQEYWEGRTAELVQGDYNEDVEFRLTLGMLKNSGEHYLHFELWAEDVTMGDSLRFERVGLLSSSFQIPSNEWFRIHVEIDPGDDEHGRFFMTITRDIGTAAENTIEIFNNTSIRTICQRQSMVDDNHDLRKTRRPIYESFSTMKCYTSTALASSLGIPLQFYFRNHFLDCFHAILDEQTE